MNSLISKAFSAAKKENRPALLTYTVAGDNTKKKSLKILKTYTKNNKLVFHKTLLFLNSQFKIHFCKK